MLRQTIIHYKYNGSSYNNGTRERGVLVSINDFKKLQFNKYIT